MVSLQKVAFVISVVAISLSVSGCGGGSGDSSSTTAPPSSSPTTLTPSPPASVTTTAPLPPTTAAATTTTTSPPSCRPDQGQCSECKDHKCLSCNPGYVIDEEGVVGGRCVASCIGKPDEPLPPKPSSPFDLNGKAWPQMCVKTSEAHFFGIGDWGGMGQPGQTWTNPGRCVGRRLEGSDDGASNVSFLGSSGPRPCLDADHWAQKYVAGIMGNLAPKVKPDYVLNVGDNFYPGGINAACGQGGDHPGVQWKTQFEDVYGIYPDLKGKPWFSVMGNHDYGGRGFLTGWDEQIFATWFRDDWVMPGQYWSRKVQYADFAVEYFFLESGFIDASDPHDVNHYTCQGAGSCYGINAANCPQMFKDAWTQSKNMLEDGLKASTAEWHIIVTHYPGPDITGDAQIKAMHEKYGIDLVFTGHQHQQTSGVDNGMHYIISGGGGGITTDGALNFPDGHDDAYGFVDFKINRTHLQYDMYSWGGEQHEEDIRQSVTLPSHKQSTPEHLVREIVI